MSLVAAATKATESASGDWLTDHATLLVGVVGVLVSGLIGPSVTAWWTSRREAQKDHRAAIAARRDDLRSVLDETAGRLSVAVTQLRPLLRAQQAGEPLPEGPREFLASLPPLGQRLRLRRPTDDSIVNAFDAACRHLTQLQAATNSQTAWDQTVAQFEKERSAFLQAGREAVHAPITNRTEL